MTQQQNFQLSMSNDPVRATMLLYNTILWNAGCRGPSLTMNPFPVPCLGVSLPENDADSG